MSLIGIDVGSSSVKTAAFSEDGKLLAVVSNPLTGLHPEPGWWEQDAEELWQAAYLGMGQIMAEAALHRDPPKAIAISASGRENFPADIQGQPLGNGIMGADIRGMEFETPSPGSKLLEEWCLECGHLRERMDPVFRLMWWRKYHPEVMEKARYFLGWHDLLTFRMTGRAVADPSTASRYAVYDLKSLDWSAKRVAQYEIGSDLLPELISWPSVIGDLHPALAQEWGISSRVQVALGGHDINCAVIGAGVSEPGETCLISGSYENLMVMTSSPPTGNMLLRGLSVMPHPGGAGYSALAVGPTGNAVLNWARDLMGTSIDAVEGELHRRSLAPSPVMAVPYLSGSMTYWEGGRQAKGAVIGLTLATRSEEIVQAFMESIAYDDAITLALLKEEGVQVTLIRATGGGARSAWWTQLKADITGQPIEVVDAPEAGALGAAILAGAAIGVYADIVETSKAFSSASRVFEPDSQRAALHTERIQAYRNLVPNLIGTIFARWR